MHITTPVMRRCSINCCIRGRKTIIAAQLRGLCVAFGWQGIDRDVIIYCPSSVDVMHNNNNNITTSLRWNSTASAGGRDCNEEMALRD